MPRMNQIRLGYTASPKYSFVYNANHFENINEYQDHTVGMNFLLKRWLNHDSQANLIHGYPWGDIQKLLFPMEMSVIYFLWGDWESRVHYTMFKAKRFIYNGETRQNFTAAMALHHLWRG